MIRFFQIFKKIFYAKFTWSLAKKNIRCQNKRNIQLATKQKIYENILKPVINKNMFYNHIQIHLVLMINDFKKILQSGLALQSYK